MKLDKFSWDWFGSARTVTITKEQTTIVDGGGGEEAITARVNDLQSQIEKADTPYIIEHLQNRLAKMVGGVSIIHVGGLTETEIGEKKDRVDDALHATKAALQNGIVPGGGAALLYASKTLKAKSIGYKIVIKACRKPFIQILENAGFEYVEARILTNAIQKGKDNWVGYDIKRDLKVNMLEAGIIDPTKVTCTTLANAASVAGTILLTECVVVDHPDNDENAPQIAYG